jgi:hypothetical protein
VIKKISVMAAIAVAGVTSPAALAMAPYSVHVKVPSFVKKGTSFTLTVYGNSANLSLLRVFHDNKACGSTVPQESSHPHAVLWFKKQVVNSYSVTPSYVAGATGQHYLCTYLTSVPPPSPGMLRAEQAAVYTVT